MPNSGLDVMIDLDKVNDIARLYRLFTMVPEGLPTLRKAFKETINNRGRAINTTGSTDDGQEEEADPPERTKGKGKAQAQPAGSQTLRLALKWVEDVLALKDKFEGILRNALQSDRELESGINEVYSVSIIIDFATHVLAGFRVFYQCQREIP
jgi:cullin 3